jgi:hypothetical protein
MVSAPIDDRSSPNATARTAADGKRLGQGDHFREEQ